MNRSIGLVRCLMLVLFGASSAHAQAPAYNGTVEFSGSTATVRVESDPPATAVLIYPTPPGGGYFMTNDGTGTFEHSFGGLSAGTSFSFHLVIQVPQQYGPLETHTFTLSEGSQAFSSDGDDGGNNGGDNGGEGPGSGGPLPMRGFRHDVVESGASGWAIRIETASPISPIPTVTGVDVRYRVNSGPLSVVTMQPIGDWTWTFEVPGLEAGDELSYSFIETIGLAIVDTSWFTRTVGEAAPEPPAFPMTTTGTARFRDRHENEWRFDHYVAGYDVGRTFDVELTDHGDSLHVRLTTRPEVPVNDVDLKWYNQSAPGDLCDRMISAIGVRMNRVGDAFEFTIPDLVLGQRVDFEFTLLAGQTYYSEFMYYYVGEGKLAQKTKDPLAYATGDASISAVTIKQFAFNQHVLNLQPEELRAFVDGKIIFETSWDEGLLFNPPTAFDCNGGPVGFDMGPSSVFEPDLLGPLYSNNSCIECHMLDGRGRVPDGPGESLSDMVIRLTGPTGSPHGAYGSNLDLLSDGSVPAEASASISYEIINGTFDDGTAYELRRPILSTSDLAYGPLGEETGVSLRVAPMLIGLGLLEAVSDADILAWEDASDADGDGISGRANFVDDRELGGTSLGRFGWKAGQPSLRQQAAAAFRDDMGMTSSLYPESNCAPSQGACESGDGPAPEVSDAALDQMESYLRGLAVPPRENHNDPTALLGKTMFEAANCAACHRPTMRTSDTAEFASFRGIEFQPFTDLLLHDMGPGLADDRAEFGAGGSEWRTPPLWAIGYVGNVLTTPSDPFDPNSNPEGANYLHDGRARTLMEAVLWHGGEAADSRDVVLAMSASERDALIEYLKFPFVDPGKVVEQTPDCPGDLTTTGASQGGAGFGTPDGVTDIADLLFFVNVWSADLGPTIGSLADVTTTGAPGGSPSFGVPDGAVDLSDLLYFVNEWTGGLGACP